MIDELKSIARQAGAAILDIYETADFGVEVKSDDSPLTRADQASNRVICKGLEQLSDQYPILSEENKMIDYDDRKDYHRYWCVDPLDGTKEFIKKNGEFTVNIALIEKGRSVLGVVYIPVTDEMYWAEKGSGAHKQVGDAAPVQIHTATYSESDSGLVLVCSRSHLNDATAAFLKRYDKPQTLSRGSSLKFLSIAEGEAHIYPRLAPTMEWDTAAAQIILEEAGGSVTQYGKDEPVVYNKADLLNPHFVARG